MKERLKSYEFWVSLASAAMVFLQTLSLKIDVPHLTEITAAFLSALCVAGVLKKKKPIAMQEDKPAESSDERTDDGAEKTSDNGGEDKEDNNRGQK